MNEKLPKNYQFPSISRFFPEAAFVYPKIVATARIIALLSMAILLIFATVKQAQLLQRNREYLNRIVLRRGAVERELSFWQKIADKYNNYPGAKLKIAELEYSLGYTQRARETVDRVLSLNPDMQVVQVLGERIKH